MALGGHASAVAAQTFTVGHSGSAAYVINGQNNPDLTLVRGQTYVFNVNTPGHPFWLKSVQGTGKTDAYNDVPNNGVAVGTLTFAVPLDAPSTLYYNCEFHALMTGTINILDPSPTVGATATPTPTVPTPTPTPTPTSTPVTCVGDCGEDHEVTVDEILTMVNIVLGTADISTCPHGIPSGSSVDVALIIQAVNNVLNGCPVVFQDLDEYDKCRLDLQDHGVVGVARVGRTAVDHRDDVVQLAHDQQLGEVAQEPLRTALQTASAGADTSIISFAQIVDCRPPTALRPGAFGRTCSHS